MQDELQKVDLIRERTGVSYKEAKDALDESGGDVVLALINIESRDRSFFDRLTDRGNEVIGQVKTYVDKGKRSKIKVKKGEKTLFEIPASIGALGVVGALMAPEIAVVGAITAIASKVNFEVEEDHQDKNPAKSEFHDIEGYSRDESHRPNDDI